MSEKKYRVERSEKFGRFLVADKDLEAGEVIFEETPFVVGPKPDSPALCLACYGPCVSESGVRGCSRCSWPVCSPQCESSPQHAAECAVFEAAGAKFQPLEDFAASCAQLDCITPLRMLLERSRQPERWSGEVETLEAHTAARMTRPAWDADQVNVAQYLTKRCNLQADEELVQRVCGILEVNSVEVPTRGESASARAIYPCLALAAHNCVPNLIHTITSDLRVEVRAATALTAGSPLFICYAEALAPTLLRREFLLASKYFECDCARCGDPTELGTHLGTLKCSKCDDGVILSTNPLDSNAGWKCSHCEFSTSADAVRRIIAVVQAEIDELEAVELGPKAIEMREQLIKKYRSAFHPRHYLLLGVKLTLGQLYGRVQEYELDELPDLLLERKLEMCRLVLQVLESIQPGESRLKATIVYELHAPLMSLARSQFEAGLIGKDELRQRLEEPLRCLEEAARVLGREDPRGAEGSLGQVAAAAAEQLRASIESL